MARVLVELFPKDNGFYMDNYLQSNLDKLKEGNLQEFDTIFGIVGSEGAGKSCFATQLAMYLDNTFSSKDIAFTPEEFATKVREAKEFKAIIFDEARTGFNRKRTMSMINKILTDLLTVIRSHKLYIILCIPDIFELDSFVIEWRLKFAIRVYTKQFRRGFFAFYSKLRIKKLSLYGRQTKDYYCTSPNFRGHFSKFWTIDKGDYQRRKDRATESIGSFEVSEQDKVTALYAKVAEFGLKNKISQDTLCEALGVSRGTLYNARKQAKSKNDVGIVQEDLQI